MALEEIARAERHRAANKRWYRNKRRRIVDLLVARDGPGCSYVYPDGSRCSIGRRNPYKLDIDHIEPLEERGGRHTTWKDLSRLRLLCHAHNMMLERIARAAKDR